MSEKFDVMKMLREAKDKHDAFDKWLDSKGGCDSVIADNVNNAVYALVEHMADLIRAIRDDHEYQPSRSELAARTAAYVRLDVKPDPMPGCVFGPDGEGVVMMEQSHQWTAAQMTLIDRLADVLRKITLGERDRDIAAAALGTALGELIPRPHDQQSG
jgi:hypothetical protein